MSKKIYKLLDKAIDNLKASGLFKPEFMISSRQGRKIKIGNKNYLNLSSDDFLGLAVNERVQNAAIKALQEHGSGLASPRVITGTQEIHQEFESELAAFFSKEAAILFSSGYDANFGFFESLFSEQDYIFCDNYAHPSVIDGIFKTPAQKMFYTRNVLGDLEDQLKRSPRARFRIIIVEGVYALDGQIAELEEVCRLAEEYDALVMLQDTLGIGVLGEKGRGTAEHCMVLDKVDIITGSFGHGLSGFDLGFVVGPKNIINWLKQNSKPYAYSTSPAPMVIGAAQETLKVIAELDEDRQRLLGYAQSLRTRLSQMGYTIIKSRHPIVGIVTNEAVKTQRLMDALYEEGIFAVGLCYPIVPKGLARVRLQLSSTLTEDDIKLTASALEKQGERLKILRQG